MNSTGKKCRGSRCITGRCSDSDVRLIPLGSMKATPLKTSDSLHCAFLSSARYNILIKAHPVKMLALVIVMEFIL